MRTHRAWLQFAVAGLLVVTGGCKQDGVEIDRDGVAGAIARAVCESYDACECQPDALLAAELSTVESCVEVLTPSLEQVVAEAQLHGLLYFSECLGRAKAAFELSCSEGDVDPMQAAKTIFAASTCKLVAGDAANGDACVSVGNSGFGSLGDTCDTGLRCSNSVCVPIPNERGDLCSGLGLCPPGLECIDPDKDAVRSCEVRPKLGDACNVHDEYAGCESGSYCQISSSTCVELPGTGMNCVSLQCAAGNLCVSGVCEVLPKLGEPCEQGVCDAGLACQPQDMVCVVPPGGVSCASPGSSAPAGSCAANSAAASSRRRRSARCRRGSGCASTRTTGSATGRRGPGCARRTPTSMTAITSARR
jgi:hypothetical protein